MKCTITLGSGLIISGPEPSCSKGDGGHEVTRQLVEASCDTSKVLEFAEEALDQIALAVDAAVDGAAHEALAGRGDMGFGPAGSDQIE